MPVLYLHFHIIVILGCYCWQIIVTMSVFVYAARALRSNDNRSSSRLLFVNSFILIQRHVIVCFHFAKKKKSTTKGEIKTGLNNALFIYYLFIYLFFFSELQGL